MNGKTIVAALAAVVLASIVHPPADAQQVPTDGSPLAIPTFHCLGLYWSPPGGSADKDVLVRYRRQGASEWKEALPMRYNPIPDTDEDLTDYRGSIVHLQPATTYEIELTLAGTSTTASLTATTWSEDFPGGRDDPRQRPRHAAGDHRVRARRRPTGSMTAGVRRSTCGTSTTTASRSTPRM